MGFEENEAALRQAVDAWNSGDVESYLQVYDEGLKLHLGTYDFPDIDSVRNMYRGMFPRPRISAWISMRPSELRTSSAPDTPSRPGTRVP
jgi:hypothetical protein